MPRGLRVLVAPNAYKGCLGAAAAALEMARGVRHAFPSASLDLMPISDGGDGLMEVLRDRLGGREFTARVAGPVGEPRRARYVLLGGGRAAVVEMAQASGIAGLARRDLDPLGATSYGTGELILAALRRGARKLVIGLGGSATNDGGAGMACALGARLLDAEGRDLPRGAAALLRLSKVDAGALAAGLGGAAALAVSDVDNPLLGPRGSARVYGPQKGATAAQVRLLDRAMARWAAVLRRDLGRDVAGLAGAGAAGGLGAGLSAFLRAKLVPGARWVLSELGAPERVRRSDLVLTGEGKMDEQSFFGKGSVALARLARSEGVPIRFLCGTVEAAAAARLRSFGNAAAYSLARPGEGIGRAMAEVRPRLRQAAGLAALSLSLLALALAALPASAAEVASATGAAAGMSAPQDSFAEADRLYFHRDKGENLSLSQASLRSILDRAPADPQALWRFGRGLMRQGERAEKKKEKLGFFEESEDCLRRSLKLYPGNAEAHFWLGVAMGRRGQARGILSSLFLIKPIREEMRKTLELDPGHGGAHHVLGEILSQIPGFAGGSKKGALAEFEKALALSPNYTVNYLAAAKACLDMGGKEKAKAVLGKLLDVKEPADPGEFDDNLKEARKLLEDMR